jgi:pyruvate dehydrogenase E2 component (dihydrolipoamide acetyltransferase)
LVRAAAIPQFTLERTVDARLLLERADQLDGLTATHLLLRSVAVALRECPEANRVWLDDGPRLVALERCDVGLAIAGNDSLVVATIGEPDACTLPELIAAVSQAVDHGRTGRLPLNLAGAAAVTVSNLGMFRVDRFRAIVDPDQAAILAVGRIGKRPMVIDAEVRVVPQLDLSLSVDHRALDGAAAARFLDAICLQIES